MIIDTTINANSFEKNFRKIYFKNYINQRKEYSSWIDSIGDKKNLDWWISLPASRNYNYSKLFHIFCLVESDRRERTYLVLWRKEQDTVISTFSSLFVSK